MVKTLAHRWLQQFSRRYDYDTGYMQALLQNSTSAFFKYALLNLLSSHRRGITPGPWWAARIRAALHEDCGPCVQLVCNMALEAGIAPATIAAIVAADMAALDGDIALALRFTEAVLAHNPAADDMRLSIRQRWGEDGLVTLALAISTTRVYPTMKYVLGYGTTCSRVHIEQQSIAPTAFHSATLGAATVGELV